MNIVYQRFHVCAEANTTQIGLRHIFANTSTHQHTDKRSRSYICLGGLGLERGEEHFTKIVLFFLNLESAVSFYLFCIISIKNKFLFISLQNRMVTASYIVMIL